MPADLSQNLDEALDLQLGLGALGGLRHSAACDAMERSQRRYEERNHRLHEARMKKLGLEGEEPEADDMAQQVLIRSPITHNHYHDVPQKTQPPSQQPSAPQQPTTPAVRAKSPWSSAWPYVLAAATGLGGVGAAYMANRPETPAEPPKVEMPRYDVEKWVPIPDTERP